MVFTADDGLVVLAGVFAGFLNVVSAGGSLVSLPLLISLGVDPKVANATNRVAIFLQNLVGVGSYHRRGMIDYRGGWPLLVPVLAGAASGGYLATVVNAELVKIFVGALMVVMIGFMLFRPSGRKGEGGASRTKRGLTSKETLLFFFAGVHGGFIQAGIGAVMLFALVQASGYALKTANCMKVCLILAYTCFVLPLFLFAGLVDLRLGVVLAVGNMLGAWLGVRFSVKSDEKVIRVILLATLSALSFHMFGGFDWLTGIV